MLKSKHKAWRHYESALKTINVDLQDPIERLSDSKLLSILLIQNQEVRSH